MFYEILLSKFGNEATPLRLDAQEVRKAMLEFERAVVLYTWRRSKGVQLRMAQIIGLNRNTVRKLLAKHNIGTNDLPEYMKEDAYNNFMTRMRL